jgi:hypothetical protein
MADISQVESRRPPQAWLIVLWLVCTLTVIGFALVSYFVGWFYNYLE